MRYKPHRVLGFRVFVFRVYRVYTHFELLAASNPIPPVDLHPNEGSGWGGACKG